MNNQERTEERRYAAMDKIREIFPAVKEYSDLDMEQLLEIMKVPARSIGSCISKEQLKTLCLQLLAQNLTLQAEVSRLQKDL